MTYTVRVPATSANLGPGFDALGLALSLHDEVTASLAETTTVEIVGEGAGELPVDDSHLIIRVMRETRPELGGIALSCRNRIPQARGLGSSSAAIVAGVKLANALTGGKLSLADELRIAGRIEGHPDNVAPCLLGGFTIAWMSDEDAQAVTMPTYAQPTVFVPAIRGLTEVARAALPATVPHRDAAFNAGRSALLVHALTAAPEFLFPATEDRLHQNYRSSGMPESAELVAKLRAAGVAAVVSGAGPTVLALSDLPPDFVVPPSWIRHNMAVDLGGAAIV